MQPTALRGLLAKLTEGDRSSLLRVGRVRLFAPGEHLCRQGAAGAFVALILRGTAKVVMSTADGARTMLGMCGPGELVGELSAVRGEGTAQEASVTAVDHITCRVITPPQFRSLLVERPAVQHAIMEQVVERMRRAATMNLHSAAYPIGVRIVHALLDLAQQHGQPSREGTVIDLALSQQDLAEFIGGHRVSVARALADLRKRELIATGRQTIVLRDLAALRARAAQLRQNIRDWPTHDM